MTTAISTVSPATRGIGTGPVAGPAAGQAGNTPVAPAVRAGNTLAAPAGITPAVLGITPVAPAGITPATGITGTEIVQLHPMTLVLQSEH